MRFFIHRPSFVNSAAHQTYHARPKSANSLFLSARGAIYLILGYDFPPVISPPGFIGFLSFPTLWKSLKNRSMKNY
jgi:hypothetical protein